MTVLKLRDFPTVVWIKFKGKPWILSTFFCAFNLPKVRISNIRILDPWQLSKPLLVKPWHVVRFIRAPCCWRILNPVHREGPSFHPALSLQSCHPGYCDADRPAAAHWSLDLQEQPSILPARVTPKAKRSIPQKWLCNSGSASWMWAGRPKQNCPSLGFFFFEAEIKENHACYLKLSWHSKSEDGVDCSLLIEHTFERCLAVCQTGFHWRGNSGARGTSSGRVSHVESLKYCKCRIWCRGNTYDWGQLCRLQQPGLYLQECKFRSEWLKLLKMCENMWFNTWTMKHNM